MENVSDFDLTKIWDSERKYRKKERRRRIPTSALRILVEERVEIELEVGTNILVPELRKNKFIN